MGMIRGGLVLLTGVLLLLSFFAGNLFLTMALSLKYDNVQPEFGGVIRDIAESEMNLTQEVQENLPIMQAHCSIEGNTEYVFKHEKSSYVFVIPCEVVVGGVGEIIEFEVQYLLDEIYYKDYDCDFINCFEKTEMPFFLISEHAKNYWQSKLYLTLLISAVLILLMLLFIEYKRNLLLVIGALLILSSLPFAKLDWFFSFFGDKYIVQIFSILFTQTHKVFLIMFIAGIVVIVLGISLRGIRIFLRFWNFVRPRKVAQGAKVAEGAKKVKEFKEQKSSKLKVLNEKISKIKKDMKKMKSKEST